MADKNVRIPRTRIWAFSAIFAVSAFAATPTAAGNIVLNGSFESPALSSQTQQQTYSSSTPNAIPNWTIGGNSIDLINKFWTSSDGLQSIDLDGNAPGSISQVLSTTAGKRYTITFKYSSHPSLGSSPASMTVSWGPSATPGTPARPPQTFTYSGPSSKQNMNWQTGTITLLATETTSSSTLLTFKSIDNSNQNYGIALDDVQVFTRDQDALVLNAPSSLTYGQPAATLTTSGGSGTGAVTYSVGASTGCSLSGALLSVTNASGDCSVTATKAGDANYDLITSATLPVTLVKASQATLTVTGPASLQFGKTATATASGGTAGALTFTASGGACAVSGTDVTILDPTPPNTCDLVATRAGDNNFNSVTSASFRVGLPGPLATPVLYRAVNFNSATTYVIGRIDGAANLPITVEAFAASSCDANGALVAPESQATYVAPPANPTTDASGYFGATFSGLPAGKFVVLRVTAPSTTARSTCIVSSADNDTWPKALPLLDGSLSASDYIDVAGRSRWYRFHVLPGQQVRVKLSGLPADYDLAVFKDIGATFLSLLAPTNTAALTKLSAEYAPSVFSPSVFSPSVFSPSVFSPAAYTDTAFSPSVFSPSVFSPSVFSPSVFSPSVFSPSVFSPSVFSPSVFSPSVFSPSVFSPSVFSPSVFSDLVGADGTPTQEFIAAFSSAQTRSIIGVSATPGTGDEFVLLNTWNNTGDFYIRVAGRSGAYSTISQFSLTVQKDGASCLNVAPLPSPPARNGVSGNYNTIILAGTPLNDWLDDNDHSKGTMGDKLNALAADSRVKGVVVPIASDVDINTLKAQATAKFGCPYAVNLVAEEIKRIVDAYAAVNPLNYVVIAGNDGAVPFFRYPDESLLGMESGYVPPVGPSTISEGSLRNDMVLSQDAYGAGTQVSIRTTTFPVPKLAVGRLVETPQEIAGMVDAFLASPVGGLQPGPALVTGYDFLSDAATAVKNELTAAGMTVDGTLIAPNNISPQDPAAWTATQLGQALLGPTRHDVVFLAGHFSANSALAADFSTSLLTTDLAASTTDFTNAIVFSAGCHSGYNIADGDALQFVTQPLDWAQAFARKKATLIAGTGYQYGDTDLLEYSERLYANFARQLHASTHVSVGQALVQAKLDYLASIPDIRGIHQKALLEATLFGLPMLAVNTAGGGSSGPGTPTFTPTNAPVPPQMASLGLKQYDLHVVVPALQKHTTTFKNVEGSGTVDSTWYSGPDGVVTNPVEPALPLMKFNATAANDSMLVLRGIGFRGGNFTEETVVPLTGAPTDELRGVHVPFVSPVFYPMRPWTVNYYGALGGTGATSLLVTPAQHRALDIATGTSTLRKFGTLDLNLFYSANLDAPSTSDAPAIVRVIALPDYTANTVTFTAQVVGDPKAGIPKVWVTYFSAGVNTWQSLDLTQSAQDSTTWKGVLNSIPTGLRYIVQAVNGFGLVTLDDNLGAYYGLGGTAQQATTTAFVTMPSNGTFGDTQTLQVNLKSGGNGLNGKSVIVAIGGAARVATTLLDGSGNATVSIPLNLLPGTYTVVASFGGDDQYMPSSASAGPISIAQAPTSLATLSLTSGVSTLTGTIGGKSQPLMQEAVTFVVSGNGFSKTSVVITDYLGRASLPPTGFPAGSYDISASFAGNATYLPVSTSRTFTIDPQTITFGGSFRSTLNFVGDSFTFTASSTLPGSPVTVTLKSDQPPKCSLTYDGTQYTLTALALGTCTLVANAPGSVTVEPVVNVETAVYVMTTQTITFNPLADKTFGDADFTVSATTTASGLTVTFAASGNCTVSGTTVHLTGAGSCTITASQAGNALYFPATPVARTFSIGKATPVFTFAALPDRTFGDADFAVTATSTSTASVTFAAVGSCSVTGNMVHLTGAGTCTITASVIEAANYLAGSKSVGFSIALANQTITFAALADRPINTPPFVVTATASSGLAVSFTAGGTCTIDTSTNTVTLNAIGSCTITAKQGGNANYKPAADVERSFLVTLANLWKPTGPMTMPRSYHTATLLADGTGRVLIAGGLDQFGAPTASTELYDPASRTFTSAGNMPSKSANHSAALLKDGRVLVVGGGNSSAQVYTPNAGSGSWAPSTSTGSNRSYATATTLPDGRVLIVGGADNAGKTLNTTIVYNPANDSFTSGPTMDTARERHTATLLTLAPNAGKVLIVGGRSRNGNGSNYTVYGTYQICDATACTASAAGPAKRFSHAALEITIPVTPVDKDVLVTGGNDGNNDLATSDLYSLDPVTSTWKWTAVSPYTGMVAKRQLAVAELPFGQAIVAGGFNGTVPKSAADVYAPPMGLAPPMGTARAGHTATTLRDSSGAIIGVLVTGGVSTGGVSVNSAETYGMP